MTRFVFSVNRNFVWSCGSILIYIFGKDDDDAHEIRNSIAHNALAATVIILLLKRKMISLT